ncbi:hypothetical protein NBRC10512_008252 [Rhodotorula toruloides]|uniref:RHTO0S16e01728g1_1 n=2 Tax=Rhodotorula toruloides TaxID=5286 RepID=A0A061BJN8_RHOTO|nr:zinc finger, MYND-type domain containing protein [Rhodotorula toruloides NP11]EMS20907.1 zinc finger, MYND-type domain containing protein [Rhodotorula toruloides NP11]CDR48122.1 RHTO0S16e01728g1_1 [Rhodotorula toruloides]
MSGPLLHRCAVCGTSTENRCSGCSKAGGPTIFFCSPDHQKLVWHNHKRVCRDKSAAFVAPPLSDVEYQHYRQVADIKFPHAKPPELRMTIAESVEKALADRKLPKDFERFVAISRTAEDLADSWKQMLLARIRADTAFLMTDPTGGVLKAPFVGSSTPWEFVAAFADLVLLYHPELSPIANQLVRFKHHTLILHTLLSLRLASSSREIPDDWILRSFENVVEALNDDIKYQHMSDIHRFSKMTDLLSEPVKRIVDFETDQGFFPGMGILELTCYPK